MGYVGLPLAVEFGKYFHTVGYDINENRVKELNNAIDVTLEVSKLDLKRVLKKKLRLTNNISEISNSNIFIITVPTPVDRANRPNLKPLTSATESVSRFLKKNDVIIFESTVFPGCTEEVCVPILEKKSGLEFNVDFFVGYSPERINPGDKTRTLTKILKVTSGSNSRTAKFIDELYKKIIKAGTFKASSIKVAEAAKVIENSQRDLNIAFVNELSKIFHLMNINTFEVLEAASTKWNFLKFFPGLVGGHCIGVDPYYLAQKSIELGYNPEIILAGRRLNDGMGKYISSIIIKSMIRKKINIHDSKILILGITFKENCPDIRNTKVVDLIYELQSLGPEITVVDPWVKTKEVYSEFNIKCQSEIPPNTKYDTIILAVPHKIFEKVEYSSISKPNYVVFDVKGKLKRKKIDSQSL